MDKRGKMIRARSVLALSLGILALALLAPIAANAQVTVFHVVVTVSGTGSSALYCDTGTTCSGGIQVWNLGAGITLQGGQTLVLSQTGTLGGTSIFAGSGNFDTSDRLRPSAPFTFPCHTPADASGSPCTVTIQLDTGSGLTTVYTNSTTTNNVLVNNNADSGAPTHQEQAQYLATPVFSAPNYTLNLGYADNEHGCTTNCFPNPFNGTGGTTAATFYRAAGVPGPQGFCTAAAGNCFDAGVLLITGVKLNLRTITQGGWGAPPHGNNPGAFLVAHFGALGGPVVIGCSTGFKLTFTSALAIQNFLPQGGTPGVLTASATNPLSSSAGVFAGQVLALQLNVSFSNLGLLGSGLGSFVLPSGPAAGKTVAQVLADANKALGGCGLPSYVSSISQLNDIVDSINETFDVD